MMKKVLLSVLCLALLSGDADAKEKFKLSDGQNRVLKVGGSVLGALAGLYGLIALIQARHKAYINRHIVYTYKDDYREIYYPENNPVYNYSFKLMPKVFEEADYDAWRGLNKRNYDVYVGQDNCELDSPKSLWADQCIDGKLKSSAGQSFIKGRLNFDAFQSPCFLRRLADAFASPLQIMYQSGQDAKAIFRCSSSEEVP